MESKYSDSLKGLEESFCLVNIDADLYLPILEGLKYFYPRMVKGGYILIHAFDGFLFSGAKSATQEYCDKIIISYNDRGGTVAISIWCFSIIQIGGNLLYTFYDFRAV